MEDPVAAPVHLGLFRDEVDGGITLVGGWSPSTRAAHFPRRARCPYTGADDVVEVDLPSQGSVWAFTEVTAAPPGYLGEVPYGIGVVELEVNETIVRVVARLLAPGRAGLRIGQPVELIADEIPGPDGTTVRTWAYRPTASEGDPGGIGQAGPAR